MDKELVCDSCRDEICACDSCGEDLKEGEDVICIGFNHIHQNCIDNYSAEIVNKEDLF